MKIRAILDPGLSGPGMVSRKIRLTREEKGSPVWEGEIHPSRGLVMKSGGSASVLVGKQEKGLLSLFRTGRWDFLLDGKPVAVANVRRGKRIGFEVGSIFHALNFRDYEMTTVMEGNGWRLDRGVIHWPDIEIEGDSMETVLAVSGVLAFYEGLLLDR